MKKILLYLLVIVTAVLGLRFLYDAATAPEYTTVADPPVDPSAEPVQNDLGEDADAVELKFEGGGAEVTLKAVYRIAAKVCGRKRYGQKWTSLVAPYDLCLAWGRAATEDLRGKVRFSQDMRWYQFWVDADSPLDPGYVQTHSANVHLISSDRNLFRAVQRLKKGDVVELTGYLVFLKGKYEGRDIFWESSLRRDDSGRGSCELFYLTSLRKGSRLYRALTAH